MLVQLFASDYPSRAVHIRGPTIEMYGGPQGPGTRPRQCRQRLDYSCHLSRVCCQHLQCDVVTLSSTHTARGMCTPVIDCNTLLVMHVIVN